MASGKTTRQTSPYADSGCLPVSLDAGRPDPAKDDMPVAAGRIPERTEQDWSRNALAVPPETPDSADPDEINPTSGKVESCLNFLLFPEVCLICGIAGILAMREPGAGVFALLCVMFLDRPRSANLPRAICLLLTFSLSYGYAALRENSQPPVPGWLQENSAPVQDANGEMRPPRSMRIRAEVAEATPLPDNSLRLILTEILPAPEETKNLPHDPQNSRTSHTYRGRLIWNWNKPEFIPLPGEAIEASLRILPQHDPRNPGVSDMDRRRRDQGIWFRARGNGKTAVKLRGHEAPDAPLSVWPSQLREKARALFYAALPRSEEGKITVAAGMLPALIFGDRSHIDRARADLFAKATLSHSLALSGLHLGFALLAGSLFARILAFFRPQLQNRLPRRKLGLLLSLPFALLYLWIGQAPVSLLRAAYMLFFSVIIVLLNRPRAILDGLCAALCLILLGNPLALFDISLQLSALCIAVIALCLPCIQTLSLRLFPHAGQNREGRRRGQSLPQNQAVAGTLPYAETLPHAETLPRAAKVDTKPHSDEFERKTPNFLKNRQSPGFQKVAGDGFASAIPILFLSEANRYKRAAFTVLGLSFCIQTILFPLTVGVFGFSGLLFPLNLLWLPVLGIFVLPLAFFGLFSTCLGFSVLGAGTLYLASLPCASLVNLLEKLDSAGILAAPLLPRPHWLCTAAFWLFCLTLPGLCKTVLAARRTPREKLKLSGNLTRAVFPPLAALLLMFAPVAAELYDSGKTSLTLTVLDVGHGQAVLVAWKGLDGELGGGRVLIDGGGAFGAFDAGRFIVAPALTYMARPNLKAAIYSHPDADHIGGLPYILERFSVDGYFGNGERAQPLLAQREDAALAATSLKRQKLHADDVLELARGLRLEVLWPPKERGTFAPAEEEKGNNLSLVLRLLWEDNPLALICGDAQTPALRSMLRTVGDMRAQALVLPHHGSRNGMAPGFYEAVNPSVALASCAFANSWGFPSRAVREALQDLAVPLYSTAHDGQIRLTWDAPGARPKIFTARTNPAATGMPAHTARQTR
ncbi:MAG: ComEC/Rec2 family competence protein [Desulfovibrio sp.]|jgi:competence protein ComEC|nr:ComEC/Rec2 family competence protein [Desulfovibrio sp.]